jgi:hypothetical protein
MLPLFRWGPTVLNCFGHCCLGLHESDIAKAPLFVAFSTVVSMQKWQQDKEGLIFSTHLATSRLAHTPYSSQSKKGLVRLLPGPGLLWSCFSGHVAGLLLPYRAAWGVVAWALGLNRRRQNFSKEWGQHHLNRGVSYTIDVPRCCLGSPCVAPTSSLLPCVVNAVMSADCNSC